MVGRVIVDDLRAAAVVMIFELSLHECWGVLHVLNFDFSLVINFFNLLAIQGLDLFESILACLVCWGVFMN